MDKYLHYNSIELAEDSSFIAWVNNIQYTEEHDWDEWVKNNPIKADVVAEAKSLVGQIKFKNGVVDKAQTDRVWGNIVQNIDQGNSPEPKRSIVRRLITIGAAAAVAILLWVTIFNQNRTTTIQSQFAETKIVDLPDGTEVSLNSDSEIVYDSKDWENERSLNLKGEAYFKVKKGSTFIVNTDFGKVEVLGTSFNVFARDGLLDVVCETGKVSVNANGKTTILTPGQAVKISNSKHEYMENIDQSKIRSNWLNGLYSYKAEDLELVLDDIRRQFDIEIIMDIDTNKMMFTGSFKNIDLDSALSEVLWPMGLKYENQEGVINITK